MIPFRKSLAFRIFAISFILLSLPLLVDSFVILQNSYKNSINHTKDTLVEIGDYRKFLFSNILQVKAEQFVLTQEFLGLKKNFPLKQSQSFNEKLATVAQQGHFSQIVLLNPDFMVVGSSFSNDSPNSALEQSHYYETIASLAKGGAFSFIYNQAPTNYYFIHGEPIIVAGVLKGFLIVVYDLSEPVREFIAPNRDGLKTDFAILTKDMITIAASDPALKFQYFFTPLSQAQVNAIEIEQPQSAMKLGSEPLTLSYAIGYPFFQFRFAGKMRIGKIDSIPQTAFYLMSYASKRDILIDPLQEFMKAYGVYALILLCGGLLAYFFTRRMSKPLMNLGFVMEEIQKGETTLRYKNDFFGFEINELGATFNEMLDTLLEKKRLAEEARVKSEIYDKELRVGQQVQRSLLPVTMPLYPGVELAQRYRAAKVVGGDFFDVFVREIEGENELVLAIADTSGKGVKACFYSLGIRSHLRIFARENKELSEVIKNANRLFAQDSGDSCMFATTSLAFYNHKTRKLHYCRSGHTPAILRRAHGEIELLQTTGIALGVEENIDVTTLEIELQEGDLLVFYTDGITDAQNARGEFFSEERMIGYIEQNGEKSPEELAQGLIDEVLTFSAEVPQFDDMTLLILRVHHV